MFIYILGYAHNTRGGMAGQFEFRRSPEEFRELVMQHLRSSDGFEHDYRIVTLDVPDDLDNESILEQLENTSFWVPSPIGKDEIPHHHEPDWLSVTYDAKASNADGLLIDVNCRVCGISGSTRLPSEVLNW